MCPRGAQSSNPLRASPPGTNCYFSLPPPPSRQKILRICEVSHSRLVRIGRSYVRMAHPKALATDGTTMRRRKQFAIRLAVAVGLAFVGMGALGTVIAFSAVERARMIAEEAITKPFPPPR